MVIAHFNSPYLQDGNYVISMFPFGIYIGDFGVTLFFIISGAALMVTYRERLTAKTFYRKRFVGIYPMFWIAWIIGTAYFIIANHGVPANNGPVKSVIWTILGVDGLVSMFHVPTMYLLGEWFLGVIIIFYLVFPLLRWAILRHPIVTALILLALYGATLAWFQQPRDYPAAIILTMRLPELAFGMYFARYVKKVHILTLVPAAAVLVLSSLYPNFNENIATTGVGIAAFLVLVVAAPYLDGKPTRAFVGLISTYSYAIFLVHHVIIAQVMARMDPLTFFPVQAYMVFGATCVMIFMFSLGLTRLNTAAVAFFARAFDGVQLLPRIHKPGR